MPSKTAFALVAVLAATSVSALPTRGGWVDLVERAPDTPAVTPPAAVGATPVVSGQQQPVVVPPPVNAAVTKPGSSAPAGSVTHPHAHHHHNQNQNQNQAVTGTHRRRRHPHASTGAKLATNADGTPVVHHKHHRHSSSTSSAVVPPVPNTGATQVTPPVAGGSTPAPPVAAGPSLTRREYYESLYVRDPTDPVPHPHPHHHHHHRHPNGVGAAAPGPNHHHHHSQNQMNLAPPPLPPAPTVQDAPVQNMRREVLERRGLLETLGLKARVSSLTVKQTEQMSKAKTICGNLSSKKDQHTCHKTADKIIQLTKERNYDVEQFIKLTNHHDVFTSSDPSLSSSSTSSH